MKTTLFITSSGTEIGKTFVSSLIIRQLRKQGYAIEALKPVISGLTAEDFTNSDTALLLTALERPVTTETIEQMSPWRFKAALSPDMAAAKEGREVSFDALVEYCTATRATAEDVLLIEGVGGVMVPLDQSNLVVDWIAALAQRTNVRPVLVVGSYLGTLSHTFTAAAVLAERGVPPVAVIVSETLDSTVELSATVDAMIRFLPDVPIVTLPRLNANAVDAPDLTFFC